MRLKGVSFENWLGSHTHKDPEERWLRELYPWPVFAQIECSEEHVDVVQRIEHDGARYDATIQWVRWQPSRGTFRYRVLIESEGLGWHSRAFSDLFDICGTDDGSFVTLFHTKKREPLERIARAFFARRWSNLRPREFKSLAVSRFLAASIVSQVIERAYSGNRELSHHPQARIAGGYAPMFSSGNDLWLGFRFLSEDAFAWARSNVGNASEVIAVYFADTRYQFKTCLPDGTLVRPISEIDADLGGEYRDLITLLLRRMELPTETPSVASLEEVVRGRVSTQAIPVTDADVNEALAALKRPCESKSGLRYQLAAGVVLNAWIERERAAGFPQRKKFYAFKQRIGTLLRWVVENPIPGVSYWAEYLSEPSQPIVYIRVDGVDFSFHAVPGCHELLTKDEYASVWSGVRLKPIAPLVLGWARHLLEVDESDGVASPAER